MSVDDLYCLEVNLKTKTVYNHSHTTYYVYPGKTKISNPLKRTTNSRDFRSSNPSAQDLRRSGYHHY